MFELLYKDPSTIERYRLVPLPDTNRDGRHEATCLNI